MKVKIDTNVIFTEFFKLSDWKQRSLGIGGMYLIISVLGMALFALTIFLMLGDLLFAFLLFLVIGLILLVTHLIVQLYLAGYKLDLVKVMQHDGQIESVAHLADYGRRITQGFKLNLSQLAYILIPTLILFVGSFVNSFSSQFMETTEDPLSAEYWIFLISGNAVVWLGTFLQFLTRLLFFPLLTARFINNEGRIADTINMSAVLNAIKLNFKEILIVGGLIFLAQTIVMFAIYMSAFFILLCVGLFLLPVALSVGTVYMQHFEARMVTSLLNSSVVKE
ncbi:MAG TPA: DUF4013 domain-containing protein [Candidatus Dojkabacteria bacterium]|nr:DUF4013 domain-containing protein [Candidatus Dojkabacteria bacterium]